MKRTVVAMLALGIAFHCGFASARYIQGDPVGIMPNPTPRAITASDVLRMQRLNHPYAYAMSNPLRYVDPLGLTAQDIQNMLDLVNVTQADLNVPPSVTPTNLGKDIYGNPIGGMTNPLSLNVSISDRYLQKLSCREIENLFELIVHESIHRSRPRLDMIFRPVNHPDITEDAARRTRESKDLIRNYCPCP